jgi:hypothetical protein
MMRRYLLGVALALAVAGSVTFAQGKPEQLRYRMAGEWQLGSCGDIPLIYTFDGTYHEVWSTDKDGTLTLIQNFHMVQDTYHLEGSDHVLLGSPGVTETARVTDVGGPNETVKIAGNLFRVNIPGYGLIFAQSGKVVFGPTGVISRGHTDFWSDQDFDALCSYLLSLR